MLLKSQVGVFRTPAKNNLLLYCTNIYLEILTHMAKLPIGCI